MFGVQARRLLLSEAVVLLLVVYAGAAVLYLGVLSSNFVLGMSVVASAAGVALSFALAISRRRAKHSATPQLISQRQLDRRLGELMHDIDQAQPEYNPAMRLREILPA